MERIFTNTNMDEARENVPDIVVHGDPGIWVCLCKASSKKENWMKSTKVMELPEGCLVQVTEVENGNPATALVYVPGVVLADFHT